MKIRGMRQARKIKKTKPRGVKYRKKRPKREGDRVRERERQSEREKEREDKEKVTGR